MTDNMQNMITLYQTNEDVKGYVDRYCTKHRITVSTALTHEIVKEYARYICLRD